MFSHEQSPIETSQKHSNEIHTRAAQEATQIILDQKLGELEFVDSADYEKWREYYYQHIGSLERKLEDIALETTIPAGEVAVKFGNVIRMGKLFTQISTSHDAALKLTEPHRTEIINKLHAAELASGKDPRTGLIDSPDVMFKEFRREQAQFKRDLIEPDDILAWVELDIDDLKKINTLIGQDGADQQVIYKLAEILTASTRPGDTIARPGGDEFAILARVKSGGVRSFGERIEKAISAIKYGLPDQEQHTLTCSIGIHILDKSKILEMSAQNGKEFYSTVRPPADEAAKFAKKQGKNSTYIYKDDNNFIQLNQWIS